jgi:hypothetical protein
VSKLTTIKFLKPYGDDLSTAYENLLSRGFNNAQIMQAARKAKENGLYQCDFLLPARGSLTDAGRAYITAGGTE